MHFISQTDYWNFDYAPEMISTGKKRFPFLNLKICKDNKMDISSDSTDLVLLFAVHTCITDNEKQKELIDEIRRVLKPGGLIYLSEEKYNPDFNNSILKTIIPLKCKPNSVERIF
jgi:ubiquinone/menaquinone biosynthesis C-methylase UbiE